MTVSTKGLCFMAGGIDELIDVLYGMVEEAWSMPLGRDKCLIERERVLDILDELRVNLPGEIKAARDVGTGLGD